MDSVIVGDFRDTYPNELNGQAQLVFTDPPFNIGHSYVGFDDKFDDAEYAKFVYSVCSYGTWCLKRGGRLCVHVPDEVVLQVQLSARNMGLIPADWIIWHYRFGQCGRTRYINSKCHLLTFLKPGGEPVWNPDAVMVESDRATKYNDVRTEKTATPGQRVPLDVWGIPSDGSFWGRVQGNSVERRSVKNGAPVDHPNQLPEVYLERVIRGWTNPGDLVVDFCGGSGTTPVVAEALGRRAVTFEISEENARSIEQRLRKGAVRV